MGWVKNVLRLNQTHIEGQDVAGFISWGHPFENEHAGRHERWGTKGRRRKGGRKRKTKRKMPKSNEVHLTFQWLFIVRWCVGCLPMTASNNLFELNWIWLIVNVHNCLNRVHNIHYKQTHWVTWRYHIPANDLLDSSFVTYWVRIQAYFNVHRTTHLKSVMV